MLFRSAWMKIEKRFLEFDQSGLENDRNSSPVDSVFLIIFPYQFGLIHGDFWAGNLLINQQEIGVIDFADCGFGYWIYDLARFLNDYIYERDFLLYLDKLLYGYNQIRPFPEAQLPHIKTFIAAQYAAYGLWQVNRSQDHPSFRASLEEELQETAVGIEQFMAVG